MLTLYQKGQIQRELEGEVRHSKLLALQYLHLLVPVMNALCAISHTHTTGIVFSNN